MARAGDVLENPVTGERIVFRKTAHETNGEALEYDIRFTPKGFVAQEHLHPQQSERHEVVSGRLGLSLGGRDQVLEAGDVVVVPPRTPHRLFPVDGSEVDAVLEVRPALDADVLIETIAGLARDGKVNAKGNPRLLQLAVIAREFEHIGYTTRPPLAVQRVVLGGLAAIGRRLGYRARYPEYSGQGGATPAANEYVFLDEWDVAAPIEAVFDAIADARTYPEWWRPVYMEATTDGPPAIGRTSSQYFKGRLPYKLRTRSEIIRLEPPRIVEADVRGDLSGRGLWTLTPTERGTHVRFDWRVLADRPLLRRLTPVLRPLFRWNHNWAIARAMEGLEPYARQRGAGTASSSSGDVAGARQENRSQT
jgi:mannose-6-phosphate isomerase-like protein (cupin superfamily)/uncharacterized protein YndB with AHSA1/START domain